jgi:hypothetical protein
MRGKFAGRTGLKTATLTGSVTGVFSLGEVAETKLKGRSWPDTHTQPVQPPAPSSGGVGIFFHSPAHVRPSGPVFVSGGTLS